MNRFIIFILGMITGALLLYSYNSFNTISDEEKLKQQLLESLSNKLINSNTTPEVQYIDVEGKKGNVTLYTGMPKDSVKLLMGKNDEVDFYEVGNTQYEKWGYKLKNKYTSDLQIEFENGRMRGINQY